MADISSANQVMDVTDGRNIDGQMDVIDLGAFVGDLSFDEDLLSDDVSLEGLEHELEECKDDDVVAIILSKGLELRDYTKTVEKNLREVELDSIQDYIAESDYLLSLHDQIRDCDVILSQMESLLSGFQAEIGSISLDIKVLQEKSMDMGLKLKNRKVAESKLAKFVEDIIIPPRMIDVIVDGEVFEFIVQKPYALRKPKTNIQILKQSVLLKCKYVIHFLKEHGKEVYTEVRAAYIDTMNKLEMNSERYGMAVFDLIMKLSTQFHKSKLQGVFLINNYDMTISVLKEADPHGGKVQIHFEEVLKSQNFNFCGRATAGALR